MTKAKSWLPIVLGSLLFAYVLLLLAITQYEQRARQAADLEQYRLSLEKRAAALSYFYSVRRDDLGAMAEHRSVTTYFANRALGMSLQYGLGASLLKMRRAFLDLVKGHPFAGQPVYERLVFREPDGNVLVDTKPGQTLPGGLALDPNDAQVLALGHTGRKQVLVTTPIAYKNAVVGHLLAWINYRPAHERLIAADSETLAGKVALHIAGDVYPKGLETVTGEVGVWQTGQGSIVGRVAVADTPFEILGRFSASGLSALFAERWFSVALVVLAALIFLGAWTGVRMYTRNSVLQAHVEEARRQEQALQMKNQELEREVTQRRSYEKELLQARAEAEAALRAKSAFLTTMSHELRTPLNGVLGVSDILLRDASDPKQHHRAKLIHQSGKKLLTLIDDVLEVSSLDTGEVSFAQLPFDLYLSVAEVTNLLVNWTRDREIEVQFHYPPDLPRLFLGDSKRIQLILIKLLDNAAKFTRHGRIMVSVTSLVGDERFSGLRLGVRDTGIGIATDKQDKLFQPFSQVDNTNTREFGGAGLGLAIAAKLVHLMGGQIGVESVPDQGSEFWFELNLPVAADAAQA